MLYCQMFFFNVYLGIIVVTVLKEGSPKLTMIFIYAIFEPIKYPTKVFLTP